jgi:hypothetical protein
MIDLKQQNFLSVDQKTAINSYGEVFTIGDEVEHDDEEAGCSIITSFMPNKRLNEVSAFTPKGMAHIDFLTKTTCVAEKQLEFLVKQAQELNMGYDMDKEQSEVLDEVFEKSLIDKPKRNRKK